MDETGEKIVDQENQIVDLNGEFRFKIDAKGRMSLPASFRKAMSANLVVTIDLDDECLYVFEQAEFNAWVQSVLTESMGEAKVTSKKYNGMRRKLKSRARDVEVDTSGRIIISAEQRRAVGIEKDVVIVGNTGFFEVWDVASYEKMDAGYDLSTLSRP